MAAIDLLDSFFHKYDNTTSGLTANKAKTAIDELAALYGGLTLQIVTDGGATTTNSIEASSFVKTSGLSTEFLKADGSVDSNSYYLASNPNNYISTAGEINDLTASVTWANVPDVNITSSSVTQHQTALSITESQISDLQTYYLASNPNNYISTEVNDLTASVTWANVPDVNITSSSVTQHQAALSITESQISDASLDTGGKVPTTQLPALALTEVSVVADQAARLALTAQEGDVAIQTDISTTFIHNGGTAGTTADWNIIEAPVTEVDPVFTAHTTNNITNGTGFLKNNGSGVWSYDNATYLTASDPTLASVTNNGNTTTNAITVGTFTSTGIDDNATSTAITIDASENVGIGATSPKTALDIIDASAARIYLGTDASNYGGLVYSGGVMNMRGFGTGTAAVVSADATNSKITFTTAGVADRVTIDSNGNVSIGAGGNIPDSRLHIGDTAPVFTIEDTSASTLINSAGSVEFQRQSGFVYGGLYNVAATSELKLGTNFGSGFLTFATDNDVERMRIDASGDLNLGLTTGTPTGGVTLQNGAGVKSGPVMSIGGTDTAVVTGDTIGALAFVTADGSYTGTYADGIGAQIAAVAETAVGGGYGLAFTTGVTTGSNRAERMRIKYDGNVGIGTSIPNTILDIEEGAPVLRMTATTTTGTTLGNKGAKLLMQSDSSTAGNGGEIVWTGDGDATTERWAAISGHIDINSVNGCAGSIVFANKENDTDTTLTERMRIHKDGSVYWGDSGFIGNASAGRFNFSDGTTAAGGAAIATFQRRSKVGWDGSRTSMVIGTTDVASARSIEFDTNAEGAVTFAGDGKVGIGTGSNIDTLLHIQSAGPAVLKIEADTDNVTETDNAGIILSQDANQVVARLGFNSGGNSLELINEFNENVFIGVNNTTNLTINATSGITSTLNITAPGATLTGLSNQASEGTALMINGSNVVGTRELGSNAFNSTAFLTANQTITLSGDVTGTGTTAITCTVVNDSHTHAFNNLTGKTAGTGDYLTSGDFGSGEGSGGVAMTINDGYGNANLTFNHRNGTPDNSSVTQSACRIETSTDANAGSFSFEIGNSTVQNTPVALTQVMYMSTALINAKVNLNAEAGLDVTGNITVDGTVDGRDVAADGTKLDGIDLGAEVNVGTNISVTENASTVSLTSSTGTGDSIAAATGSLAGVMTATDKAKLDASTSADTASTLVERNGSGDIFARLFRSDYQNQATISGAMAYRVNTTDNYIRFCSDTGAIRTYLGVDPAGTNNYVHPSHPGDDFSVDTGELTGATVVSDIDINVTTDTLGHVTDANGSVNTRVLTVDDLSATGVQPTARGMGWEGTYGASSAAVAENAVTWDNTEKCLAIKSNQGDTSIGAAYRAVYAEAGATVRWTVTLKGSAADADGLYLRLYGFSGTVLPDGKTHVSNSSANGSPFVEEETAGNQDTGWYENLAVPSAWTTFERSWTVPATGYYSLVILNWSGFAGTIYVRQPDVSLVKPANAVSADAANNVFINNAGDNDTVMPILLTADGGNANRAVYEDASFYFNSTNNYLYIGGYLNGAGSIPTTGSASAPPVICGGNGSDNFLRGYAASSVSVGSATTAAACTGNSATVTLNAENDSDNTARDMLYAIGSNVHRTSNVTYNGSQDLFKVISGARFEGATTVVNTLTIQGTGSNLDMLGSAPATDARYLYLPRGGGITLYGNTAINHGIFSRDLTGVVSDDVRINSYGGVSIILDTNSNNSSGADFHIGRHSTTTADLGFVVSGETYDVTTEGNLTAYGTVSDIRYKEDIEKIDSPVERLQKINGVTFKYKDKDDRLMGVIAQELLEDDILKLAVYENETIQTKEKRYAVRYEHLTAMLIEAIKEQQKQIDELKEMLRGTAR
jgi:hypothetical protein